MTKEDIKQELIDIQTIQILLDDKMHRFADVQDKLSKKIKALEKEIEE